MDTSKLMNRLTGAVMFRTAVYDDVEADATFTPMAWIIVIVTAVVSRWPSLNIADIIISGIFAVIAFFIGAWVISWVGRTVFKATVTTDELIRTLGLAYIWNILGVFSFIPCLGILIGIAAAILGLIAWFVAAKAALDLDWVQTIVTVVIGWLVIFVIMAIVGAILAVIGIGAGVGMGLLNR